MRKYQQNQQKRTSPFLYFAADNSEETEDTKTDHDQLKFGRSEVQYCAKINYSFIIQYVTVF